MVNVYFAKGLHDVKFIEKYKYIYGKCLSVKGLHAVKFTETDKYTYGKYLLWKGVSGNFLQGWPFIKGLASLEHEFLRLWDKSKSVSN